MCLSGFNKDSLLSMLSRDDASFADDAVFVTNGSQAADPNSSLILRYPEHSTLNTER